MDPVRIGPNISRWSVETPTPSVGVLEEYLAILRRLNAPPKVIAVAESALKSAQEPLHESDR